MGKAPAEVPSAAEVAKRVGFKHEAMLKEASQEAHHLFVGPVRVTEEDRLHGLGGILEKKLAEANIITDATPAQKKNYMVHFLEKHLQALGPETLKKLGFESGTVRIIRAGEYLDLSVLDKNGWIQAIR